jgi:hypothetical protein
MGKRNLEKSVLELLCNNAINIHNRLNFVTRLEIILSQKSDNLLRMFHVVIM